MLRHFRHILQTKGLLLAVRRLFDIFARFALGRRRFLKLLEGFDRIFARNGLQGTFFVTGILLKRHSDLIKKLHKQGHCLAVHGYFHVRMDRYSRELQDEMVGAGAASFRKHGLEPHGFRPPYLNYNRDTMEALVSWGYKWSSCRYLLNHLPGSREGSAVRLNDLYHIRNLDEQISLPREEHGIIDIPITGPDDELMVDRYRITAPEAILKTWLGTWTECHSNGELYHLMFHPERFLMLAREVEQLIAKIRGEKDAVWIASLPELAEWWDKRRAVRIELDRTRPRCRALFRDMPENGTVLLSNPGDAVKQTGSCMVRGSLVLEPVEETDDGPLYLSGNEDMVFAVGLSTSAPVSLEEFLRDEGFLTVRTEDAGSCSVYLDHHGAFNPGDQREMLARIESFGKPVIRLWRWPGKFESAVTFSADICAIDFWDFVARSWHFHSGRV